MIDITLEAEVNPVPWKSPIAYRRGRGVGTAPAPELVAYAEALREWWRQVYDGPLITEEISICWGFARHLVTYVNPETGRKVTKHKADATNMIKSAEDSLQGVVIKNDNQVRHSCGTIVAQSKEVPDPYVTCRIATWTGVTSLHGASGGPDLPCRIQPLPSDAWGAD